MIFFLAPKKTRTCFHNWWAKVNIDNWIRSTNHLVTSYIFFLQKSCQIKRIKLVVFISFLMKLFVPQFYIQLVYKPNFLFGPFWQLCMGEFFLSISEQLLRVFFSIYENFFWKYCSVLTKKLDKMYLYFFFLMFFGVKIGYHSRFNPECNTERGFTDSLPMALGFVLQIRFSQLLIWQVFWRRKVNIRSTNHGIYHELHDA